MFGFKVYIFTYRDWARELFDIEDITKKWLKVNDIYPNRVFMTIYDRIGLCFYQKFNRKNYGSSKSKIKVKAYKFVEKIHSRDFKRAIYNKIYFEKGNQPYAPGILESRYKNRFYHSKRMKLMYFVEDNLMNAKKLSQSCKFVFLIDHPYNQINPGEHLPINIIRVDGWDEIYYKIEELG
jgi:hypothetical protein